MKRKIILLVSLFTVIATSRCSNSKKEIADCTKKEEVSTAIIDSGIAIIVNIIFHTLKRITSKSNNFWNLCKNQMLTQDQCH